MRWFCVLAVLVFAPVFPAAAQSSPASSAASAAPSVLRPGDAVRITVWQRPEMSGEFLVAGDGSLIHPLFRVLRVDGIDGPELEERVRGFLSRFEANPQFVVEPLFRVVVEGAVRRPGMHSVPPGTTVRQAVLEAGGVTDQGVQDRVRLVRNGVTRTVELSAPGGTNMLVLSGDEIVVARRRSIMRDYVGPVSSVLGATSAIIHLVWRLRQ
jgi:protein involved in polysaccharide export with SLBB domain